MAFKCKCFIFLVSERDNLEHDQMDVARQLAVLEGAYSNLQKERDDLAKEVSLCTAVGIAHMFTDFNSYEQITISTQATKMASKILKFKSESRI